MFEAPSAWPVLGGQIVEVAPKGIGDKGRTAKVLLKAGTVTVKRSARGCGKNDPQTLTLTMVEVTEIDAPEGAEPLLCAAHHNAARRKLGGSHGSRAPLPVALAGIEQLFRTLKKDGLDLEATQHEEASRIMKLAALGVVAAAASCSWLTPATAAAGPPRMRFRPGKSSSPRPSPIASKAQRNARKTPGKKVRWLGWPGSQPASADGTATMGSLGPNHGPWLEAPASNARRRRPRNGEDATCLIRSPRGEGAARTYSRRETANCTVPSPQRGEGQGEGVLPAIPQNPDRL